MVWGHHNMRNGIKKFAALRKVENPWYSDVNRDSLWAFLSGHREAGGTGYLWWGLQRYIAQGCDRHGPLGHLSWLDLAEEVVGSASHV